MPTLSKTAMGGTRLLANTTVSLAPPFPHAPLRAGTQTPALVFTARLHHVVLSAEPPSWCSPVVLSRTATGVRTVRNED